MNAENNTVNDTVKSKSTEYFKKWRLENKEKMLINRKTWYDNHKNEEQFKEKRKMANKKYQQSLRLKLQKADEIIKQTQNN